MEIIEKKKFNAYRPLKLKRKKGEVNKKNFAELPTLFQNKGEIGNNAIFLGPSVPFWDQGKHCWPRSDATEHSVWSGSALFANMNFYQKYN